jgi:hypothetical protein
VLYQFTVLLIRRSIGFFGRIATKPRRKASTSFSVAAAAEKSLHHFHGAHV